jgi:hypothetical protein
MEALTYSELILRQKILASVFILLFAMLTIEFIRRRELKERYAILWLVACFVLIPMVLNFDIVKSISRILGIAYPPMTILLTAILFIILMVFHFSVSLSKSRRNETRLLLKVLELEERIKVLEGGKKSPDGEQTDGAQDEPSPSDRQ